MRARFDPAQRWMPEPKATWRLTARSRTTLSASSKTSGSRLAAGKVHEDLVPGLHRDSRANSTSSVTIRAMVTGE